MNKEKILVISRQCARSTASEFKSRPTWFSKELCFDSISKEVDNDPEAELIIMFDGYFGNDKINHPRIDEYTLAYVSKGTEAGAFLDVLNLLTNFSSITDDQIIYIVEDDYLHKPGWLDKLREGIALLDSQNIEGYVTLYDHRDKYMEYQGLTSKIWVSETLHWRTVPSTTNTYAFRMKNLRKTLDIHKAYSENIMISRDHEKFLHLGRQGQIVISPIPGWSTHADLNYSSPCVNWGEL